jgi:hypothetical protein
MALAGAVLDLEPFIIPGDLDARLAAQEVRLWLGVLLCTVDPVQYETADDHLRLLDQLTPRPPRWPRGDPRPRATLAPR